MIEVRDVKEFAAKNEEQLIRFFKYKTGIFDQDLVDEHIQEFYVKLIQTNALKEYDRKKGTFDAYIFTLLCWILPIMAKKNVSVKHKFIYHAKIRRNGHIETEEIWDHVGNFKGPYKVDPSGIIPDIINDRPDDLFDHYMYEFKKYIKRTESSNSYNQMVFFLERKQEGCNSAEIAAMLNVSDNMIKVIKQKIQRKFTIWKTLR